MSQTQRIPYVERPNRNEPDQRPDRQSVVIRRQITKGEKWLWLIGGLIIFLLAVGMVMNQTRLYMLSRDIEQLEQKTDRQVKLNKEMRSEVNTLSSAKRIAKIAEEELGLKLDPGKIKVLP